MAAVAGSPSITVPVGDARGLPLGLTIMGRAFDENGIIALAAAIEQKMKARFAPEFRPTLESR
jgi:amidase